MTDPRLTTASEMSHLYRQRAERAFDEGDVTVWERMTDAADRYAAMDPATTIPCF